MAGARLQHKDSEVASGLDSLCICKFSLFAHATAAACEKNYSQVVMVRAVHTYAAMPMMTPAPPSHSSALCRTMPSQ
jgi:hypothetical protein